MKLSFLPTKFKYNSYRKEIDMWYRQKNDNKLYKTSIPFEYYIYIDSNYHNKNIDTSIEYRHLTTNKSLHKYYCDTKDAYSIINDNVFSTGEADVSCETRFITDSFYNIDYPSDINPRVFFCDIETSKTIDGKFPSFKNNSAIITAITIYDNYTDRYYSFCLVPDSWNKSIIQSEKEIKELTKKFGKVNIFSFTDPQNLLKSFMNFLIKETPDIFSGWNSSGFDIPYIVRKIYDYFGEDGLKSISPFNRVSSKVLQALDNNDDLKLDTIIPGIDCLDLLLLYKKFTKEKESYKLNFIANLEVGEAKIGYEDDGEGENLFDLYENNYTKFIQYNIQDVRLLKLIEEKCKVLNLSIAIRNYTKIDYQSTLSTTTPIDSLFLMEAVQRRHNGDNRVLPSKKKNNQTKFTGAYVKPPIVGRYKWLADADYTSLYPSICKTFKISSETLVGEIWDNQVITLINIARFYKDSNYDLEYIRDNLFPKYYNPNNDEEKNKYIIDPLVNQYIYGYGYGQPLETLGDDYPINIKKYEQLYINNNYPIKFKGISEFNKWLKDNNFCLLPNGAIFDQSKDDAIISKVIADVMNKRTEYKNLMKDCLKESNKAKDEGNKELSDIKKEESEVYDMNQKAVKVINNGIYGATSSKYFRLFDLNIAEAFTTTGQVIIRNTIDIANRKLNELSNTSGKDYVLTTDTDSIIFTMENIVKYNISERRKTKLEEIAEVPKIIQKEVNTKIVDVAKDILHKNIINDKNNYLNIKNEWLASSGFFVAKKHYVFNQVFKEGIPFQDLNIVGLECKKSTMPNVIKPLLYDIIINILNFEEKDKVDKLVLDSLDKINKFNIQDIALPIGIKDVDEYKVNTPVHVRGAIIWNDYYARNELEKIMNGKIKYVFVDKFDIPILNELYLTKDKTKDPVISLDNDKSKWDYIKDRISVDYDKMKDRLINMPVKSYYEAIGWRLPTKLLYKNNSGLFDDGIRRL